MRKRQFTAILAALPLALLITANAFAQDPAPTQILYIPGMPAPPVDPTPAPSIEKEHTGTPTKGLGQGRVSKVTVAGQVEKTVEPTPAPRAAVVAPVEAEYKGVTPPKKTTPDNASIFEDRNNQLTWIGFLSEDKEDKIFVQCTKPAAFTQVQGKKDKEVVLILKNVRAKVANNRRSLDMQYFNTRFKSAQAIRQGKDLRVTVELHDDSSVKVYQEDNLVIVAVPKVGN